ncbi:RNA polymerase II C-terminal domain phosphatase-like 5 [Silene latifolia]|uniref:RNA polymerase II C-terminal domain phosphatase-like 5 n=1 Tax=Silene latifolia TaxID=37657 RepID=UPI003D774A03
MGNRPYAKRISRLLEDCCGNEFRFGKVLSKEDCATKGLKSIDDILCDERVVVIVDDTWQVWMGNEANLVSIRRYNFFTSNRTDSQPKSGGVEVEGAMDEELARVLRTLRLIHRVFYGHNDALVKDEVDVREVIDVFRLFQPRQNSMEQVMASKQNRSVFTCYYTLIFPRK